MNTFLKTALSLGFAKDTWKGVRLYSDSPFAMNDKVAHLLGWAILWALLSPLPLTLVWWAASVVLWESLEHYRMTKWVMGGRIWPRPAVCEEFSWRDCVADALGAGLMQVILWWSHLAL